MAGCPDGRGSFQLYRAGRDACLSANEASVRYAIRQSHHGQITRKTDNVTDLSARPAIR